MAQNKKEYLHDWYLKNRSYMIYRATKYNKEHPEMRDRIQFNYSRKLKLDVLTHYSWASVPRCVHCGFDDIRALELDHINGGGEQERKKMSGYGTYRLVKKLGYPEGYQTLCSNCNRIKQFEKREFSNGISKR